MLREAKDSFSVPVVGNFVKNLCQMVQVNAVYIYPAMPCI